MAASESQTKTLLPPNTTTPYFRRYRIVLSKRFLLLSLILRLSSFWYLGKEEQNHLNTVSRSSVYRTSTSSYLISSPCHTVIHSWAYCYTLLNVLLYTLERTVIHSIERTVIHSWTYCYTLLNVLLYTLERTVIHSWTYCYTLLNVLLYTLERTVIHSWAYCYTLLSVLLYTPLSVLIRLLLVRADQTPLAPPPPPPPPANVCVPLNTYGANDCWEWREGDF